MKDKKIPSNISRNEIIAKNFFTYLNKAKITQKKYCQDNHLEPSTLSKWKKGSINMNSDNIYQAADYFKITINDLYYTEYEKKKISVLSDIIDYDSIQTQKLIRIKQGLPVIKLHFSVTFILLLLAIIFFLIDGQLIKIKNSACLLFFLFVILIATLFIVKLTTVKHTLIINYLEDIFYKIERPDNQYRKTNIIIKSIDICLLIIYIFLLIIDSKSDINNDYFMFYWLFLSVYILFNLSFYIYTPKKFKKEIYDFEMNHYWIAFFTFVTSLIIASTCLILIFIVHKLKWYMIIVPIIDVISKAIVYIFVSKKFGEYNLVIMEKNNNVRKLFKN